VPRLTALTNRVRHWNGSGGAGLRVGHLGKFYPPASGGMETHLRTLAQAALGANVHVLCVNHRDGRGRDVTWEA
jgi:hypothetical protein